ncbi:MAG: hypothetical protein GW778_03605 [Alphaproteobacteria bacterium]|nr:hypothetical protein [Alphaproteobacteria bacterium]
MISGLLLLIVGAILILSEIFIPMFGLVGLIGLALVIMGSAVSFDPALVEYGLAMIFAVSMMLALIIGAGLWVGIKAYRKRTQTGKEGMIGDTARVISWNDTQGRVFIDGENWHAQSAKPLTLAKDEIVRVIEMKDLTLMIEPKA